MNLRHLILACLAASLTTGCQHCDTPVPQAGKQVYLMMGQSNMAGRAPVVTEDAAEHLTMFRSHSWQVAQEPSANITAYETNPAYGPATSFGRELLRQNPSTPIGIINCAVGGTAIESWLPNPPPSLEVRGLYQDCVSMVREALVQDPEAHLAGIVFMQGESDCSECQGEVWYNTFNTLVGNLRADLGDIPIVYGQIGKTIEPVHCKGTIQEFMNWQARIHISRVSMVVTADLPKDGGGVHFTTDSYQHLGRRFANSMVETSKCEEVCSQPFWVRMFKH